MVLTGDLTELVTRYGKEGRVSRENNALGREFNPAATGLDGLDIILIIRGAPRVFAAK